MRAERWHCFDPGRATRSALVHPDIVVPDSPFDRMVAVNALLDQVRAKQARN